MQPELGVMAGSSWVSWVSLTKMSYLTSTGAHLQTGSEVNIRSRLAAALINRNRHVQDCFPIHHSLFIIWFHRLDRKIQPSKNRTRVEELLEAWPIPWINCVSVWGAFLNPHIEICNCNQSFQAAERADHKWPPAVVTAHVSAGLFPHDPQTCLSQSPLPKGYYPLSFLHYSSATPSAPISFQSFLDLTQH